MKLFWINFLPILGMTIGGILAFHDKLGGPPCLAFSMILAFLAVGLTYHVDNK